MPEDRLQRCLRRLAARDAAESADHREVVVDTLIGSEKGRCSEISKLSYDDTVAASIVNEALK